jgi:hypothetical protein
MIIIKKAKEIREELGLTHLVIFGLTADGQQHVATHGKSKIHAKEAATIGNNLKKSLKWPPELCNTKPIERICENCDFWQRNKHDPGYRIPDPFPGNCLFEPSKVRRVDKDIACDHFEPNQ